MTSTCFDSGEPVSLDFLETQTFNLIKAFRDLGVIIVSSKMKRLSLYEIRQRLKSIPEYQKIFYLEKPFFGIEDSSKSLYLGTLIFVDFMTVDVYIADLFFLETEGKKKFYNIRFGKENCFKNSCKVPLNYGKKTDFIEVFDIVKAEYKKYKQNKNINRKSSLFERNEL